MKWKCKHADGLRTWTTTLKNGNYVRLTRPPEQDCIHLAFRYSETGLVTFVALSREAAIEAAKKILSVYRVKGKVRK